tara:strand:- start:541 stop:741 length:201 start_codon:yes stop_codon:yes gene_type:complete
MIKKLDNLKDVNKIKEEIINLKKSLINFNFQKSTGQLEKTSSIRKAKKNIARLKTKISNLNGENNA